MRVLLVNAYGSASKRGRERFERFRRHVTRVVRELQKTETTRIEIVEKHRSALDAFLFELHSEFADPQHISNFDQLDLVFVDGDANSSPWAPAMRKLALLTKMCMMTGKCFFGSGVGASLLAFVCSTGGERLRVLNNDGKGSMLDAIEAVPPPPRASRATGFVSPRQEDCDVLLDTKTGDLFVFDERQHCWQPKGNSGLVLHSSDDARDYGARMNSARAGSKKAHAGQLSQPLFLAKRGELRCCIRLEVATQHTVLAAAFPRRRELVLNCKSKWDLDEEIASTGGNKYRVLMDSSRGPMLLEFGNCLGSHFELGSEYPESLALLRHFTLAKYAQFKEHAHIDRSYVAAISGSARLKQRLVMAQTKHAGPAPQAESPRGGSASRSSGTKPQHLVEGREGVGVGRTSPKRCRPVSAGPYRSSTKVAVPARTIQTSRSAYPYPASSASIHPEGSHSHSHSHRHEVTREENNPIALHSARSEPSAPATVRTATSPRESKETRPETEEPSPDVEEQQSTRRPKPTRVVRVPQKNELEKPYCAVQRFDKMRADERKHASDYYSVVNDAPYVSAYEREVLDKQKSKLRWMGGPFRTAIGKASTHVVPEAGIFAKGPFIQKNTPYYIIQRRQLELTDEREREPPRQHHPRQPSQRSLSQHQVPGNRQRARRG